MAKPGQYGMMTDFTITVLNSAETAVDSTSWPGCGQTGNKRTIVPPWRE